MLVEIDEKRLKNISHYEIKAKKDGIVLLEVRKKRTKEIQTKTK